MVEVIVNKKVFVMENNDDRFLRGEGEEGPGEVEKVCQFKSEKKWRGERVDIDFK